MKQWRCTPVHVRFSEMICQGCLIDRLDHAKASEWLEHGSAYPHVRPRLGPVRIPQKTKQGRHPCRFKEPPRLPSSPLGLDSVVPHRLTGMTGPMVRIRDVQDVFDKSGRWTTGIEQSRESCCAGLAGDVKAHRVHGARHRYVTRLPQRGDRQDQTAK